jgi:regulatory protein
VTESSAASSGPEWFGDAAAGVDAWLASARGDEAEQARAKREPRPDDPATIIPDADPESVARKILLDQLTGRARSRKELAEKLAKKLVPAEIATRLLDRFEEVGLIDDSAFARQWIESRGSQGRGLASRALAQELRRKGIDDEVARDALDEIDSEDERDAARDLVRRKLRSMSGLEDQVKVRRLVGMLARKGYAPGLAFGVVKDVVGAAAEDLSESGL